MDLSVKYKKSSNSAEAYKNATGELTQEYIDKFQIKAEIHQDESAETITAKGKGFTLFLDFKESEVHVSLDLSLMLRAFKGKVLDSIQRKLEKTV